MASVLDAKGEEGGPDRAVDMPWSVVGWAFRPPTLLLVVWEVRVWRRPLLVLLAVRRAGGARGG